MSLLRFVALAWVVEVVGLAVWGRLPFHPDLLLGMVVVRALIARPPGGAVAGFLLGLIRDLVYGSALGSTALPFALVGWIVGAMGRTVYRESPLSQGVLILLFGSLLGITRFLIATHGSIEGLVGYFLRITLIGSAISAIVVPTVHQAWLAWVRARQARSRRTAAADEKSNIPQRQ